MSILRRNPPAVRVTRGQELCAKIISIILQTSELKLLDFSDFVLRLKRWELIKIKALSRGGPKDFKCDRKL